MSSPAAATILRASGVAAGASPVIAGESSRTAGSSDGAAAASPGAPGVSSPGSTVAAPGGGAGAGLQAVLARRDAQVAQDAGGRRLQLDGGLDGLDLGYRLARLDPVALFLQPRAELDRGDGIGQPGQSNLGRLGHRA